jgi:hypothetical protein
MTQQHPIVPPPELAAKWVAEIYDHPSVPLHSITLQLVERAAQWGADQELEACCEWLQDPDLNVDTYKLRADRRPKPPSLKEQALIHFESFAATFETSGGDSDLIRRALEQLPDKE